MPYFKTASFRHFVLIAAFCPTLLVHPQATAPQTESASTSDATVLAPIGAPILSIFTTTAPSALEPIVSYPSANLIPGDNCGWQIAFNLPPLVHPRGRTLLTVSMERQDKNYKGPAVIDAYLVGEKDRVFISSGVGNWVNGVGIVRVSLNEGLQQLFRGQQVQLLLVPLEPSGISAPLFLSASPTVDFAPAQYIFDQIMAPLWTGNRTVDESVIFFRQSPDTPPSAKLLHRPIKIERVFSYATQKAYGEGLDWQLTDDGNLIAPEGSTLPVTDDSELHPATIVPGKDGFRGNDGRFIHFAEATWDHEKDLWITYQHEDDWGGPSPTYKSTELPHTLQKLRSKEPVLIVFYGDSITQGYNASARSGFAPFLPCWSELVTQRWREVFGGPIIAKNRALAGMTAKWGAENAAFLVGAEKPDLCLIAFGMNDRGANVPSEVFVGQIKQIMASVRKANPDAEFILVSSMRNNPDFGPVRPLDEYLAGLRSLQGPGVALVDMTSVDDALLRKKEYVDMSGNNVNHPNDYLVRWYAQMIASVFPAQP